MDINTRYQNGSLRNVGLAIIIVWQLVRTKKRVRCTNSTYRIPGTWYVNHETYGRATNNCYKYKIYRVYNTGFTVMHSLHVPGKLLQPIVWSRMTALYSHHFSVFAISCGRCLKLQTNLFSSKSIVIRSFTVLKMTFLGRSCSDIIFGTPSTRNWGPIF